MPGSEFFTSEYDGYTLHWRKLSSEEADMLYADYKCLTVRCPDGEDIDPEYWVSQSLVDDIGWRLVGSIAVRYANREIAKGEV